MPPPRTPDPVVNSPLRAMQSADDLGAPSPADANSRDDLPYGVLNAGTALLDLSRGIGTHPRAPSNHPDMPRDAPAYASNSRRIPPWECRSEPGLPAVGDYTVTPPRNRSRREDANADANNDAEANQNRAENNEPTTQLEMERNYLLANAPSTARDLSVYKERLSAAFGLENSSEGLVDPELYMSTAKKDLGLCRFAFCTRNACPNGGRCHWRHDALTPEECTWIILLGGRPALVEMAKCHREPDRPTPTPWGPTTLK